MLLLTVLCFQFLHDYGEIHKTNLQPPSHVAGCASSRREYTTCQLYFLSFLYECCVCVSFHSRQLVYTDFGCTQLVAKRHRVPALILSSYYKKIFFFTSCCLFCCTFLLLLKQLFLEIVKISAKSSFYCCYYYLEMLNQTLDLTFLHSVLHELILNHDPVLG